MHFKYLHIYRVIHSVIYCANAFHEFMNVIVLFKGKQSIRVWFYDRNFIRHDMNVFQSTEV